jgi:hypothetical protein
MAYEAYEEVETVEAVEHINPSNFTEPKAIVYDTFAIGLHNALIAINEACNVTLPNGLKLDDVEPLIEMRKSVRRTIGNKAEFCNRAAQLFERNKGWK